MNCVRAAKNKLSFTGFRSILEAVGASCKISLITISCANRQLKHRFPGFKPLLSATKFFNRLAQLVQFDLSVIQPVKAPSKSILNVITASSIVLASENDDHPESCLQDLGFSSVILLNEWNPPARTKALVIRFPAVPFLRCSDFDPFCE